MANDMSWLIKEFVKALDEREKKAVKPYDTMAEVVRVDGQTAYVHIPGGADETPVLYTMNARPGDTVRVRISGKKGWIAGNATNPPTDDTRANVVYSYARQVNDVAVGAEETANEANTNAIEANTIATRVKEEAITVVNASYVYASNTDNADTLYRTSDYDEEKIYYEGEYTRYDGKLYQRNTWGDTDPVAETWDDTNWTLVYSDLLDDNNLKYRGTVYEYTKNDIPLFELKWGVNPEWASKYADKYIQEDGESNIVLSGGTNSMLVLTPEAISFFLDNNQELTIGNIPNEHIYGIISKVYNAYENGGGVKFDNTPYAATRGRFIWEIRNNGHISLKRY